MRARWFLLLLAMQLVSACHSIMTFRTISPMFEAAPGTSIALTSLKTPTANCDPSRDQRADLLRFIKLGFAEESPYVFVDRSAEERTTFPMDVPEPVVMFIDVESWPCNSTFDQSVAIKFSVWTREGVEIETQRVSGSGPGDVEMLPNRRGDFFAPATHIMHNAEDDVHLRAQGENFSSDILRRTVIMFFERAYIEGAIPWSVNFEKDKLVAEGIRWAQRGHFDDAIASWQAVLRAHPDNVKALFNIAEILRIRGWDRLAQPYLDAAVKAGARGVPYEDVRFLNRANLLDRRPLVPRP